MIFGILVAWHGWEKEPQPLMARNSVVAPDVLRGDQKLVVLITWAPIYQGKLARVRSLLGPSELDLS